MKNILIVGACGAGKTWVMKQLIKKLELKKVGKVGLILYHRSDKVAVLGKYDGTTFEGGDRLSMAVMSSVSNLAEFASVAKLCVIAEGDRFTNKTYIKEMKPYIIKITDDGTVGRMNRASNQTERQIKSIQTRVANTKADKEVKNSAEALKAVLAWVR